MDGKISMIDTDS